MELFNNVDRVLKDDIALNTEKGSRPSENHKNCRVKEDLADKSDG